jgi:hypothetical protein
MCLDIIAFFAEIQIWHISRHENYKSNMLARQGSGFDIAGCTFHTEENLMQKKLGCFMCRSS